MWLDKITEIFSGSLGNSVSKIVSSFKADPTKVLELESDLKKTLLEHEVKLKTIVQQETEALLKDRNSAREREIELAKSGSKWGVITMNIAAGLIILAFFTTNVLPFFISIPVENKPSLELINARLGDATLLILGYWFGSSQGSANKQNEINKILQTINK